MGGGLSGLAAAHRLIELSQSQDLPIELSLLEASIRIGGVMGTKRIGEYLVETGADSFITNKPWAVDLCRRLGIEDRLIPTEEKFRGALVLRNGKPVPVPEGFQLLSPAKIWPVLTSPIFSTVGQTANGLGILRAPPTRAQTTKVWPTSSAGVSAGKPWSDWCNRWSAGFTRRTPRNSASKPRCRGSSKWNTNTAA